MSSIQKTKGFTLIEIMVATSIFMVIMVIALGALISSSDTSKKAQGLRTAMDNVNFAMESMTRSLRMGSNYYCVPLNGTIPFGVPAASFQDCLISGDGGGAVVFTPADHILTPHDTAYKLNPRGDSTWSLQKCDTTSGTQCTDLVSTDVDIQKLTFFVSGSDPNDAIQPSIYIIMKGNVKVKGVDNPFAIQTIVSQRSAE